MNSPPVKPFARGLAFHYIGIMRWGRCVLTLVALTTVILGLSANAAVSPASAARSDTSNCRNSHLFERGPQRNCIRVRVIGREQVVAARGCNSWGIGEDGEPFSTSMACGAESVLPVSGATSFDVWVNRPAKSMWSGGVHGNKNGIRLDKSGRRWRIKIDQPIAQSHANFLIYADWGAGHLQDFFVSVDPRNESTWPCNDRRFPPVGGGWPYCLRARVTENPATLTTKGCNHWGVAQDGTPFSTMKMCHTLTRLPLRGVTSLDVRLSDAADSLTLGRAYEPDISGVPLGPSGRLWRFAIPWGSGKRSPVLHFLADWGGGLLQDFWLDVDPKLVP